MNNIKETERAELHKTIWRIANDLRGSVDGWDFKSYVLGILFYRFISENLTSYINKNEHLAERTDFDNAETVDEVAEDVRKDIVFDYAELTDEVAEDIRKVIVREKGFFILPSELFVNVLKKAQGDENNEDNKPNIDKLNETLSNVFANIEGSALGQDSESNIKGLFDDLDVNSIKLGSTVLKRNERLLKLLQEIDKLPLGKDADFSENTIDLFGDAYEYLMQMYASTSGKSGGEFYTPQEVSELLAKITVVDKKEVNMVYDPACGSGSLLLKFLKVLGKEKEKEKVIVRQGFYGQEINVTTYNLCRINMFLHDVNYIKFDIRHGDTLTDPKHFKEATYRNNDLYHQQFKRFDAIVSNPPYSIKWEGNENPLLIADERFAPAGVLAPKSKADLAFTMHILHHLSDNGTAAIVEFPGVLYRGGAERKIRKYLIDNNFIDTVIQLPPDLFFGTSIATCIIVLKKMNRIDKSILFIDAGNLFTRNGNKNKLLPEHQETILDAFEKRKNIDHFAQLITNEAIAENGYNISVSSYVEQKDDREEINITELNAEISKIVARQAELRTQIDAIVSDLEGSDLEGSNSEEGSGVEQGRV